MMVEGPIVGLIGSVAAWRTATGERRRRWALLTLLVSWVIAVPLGIYTALHRHGKRSAALNFLGYLSLATPDFLVALLLLYQFGLIWGIAPIFGYDPSFPANMKYLWLPSLVNCVVLVPVLSRVLYSSILDTLDEEFVETGVIRGVRSLRFFWFYVLRPSLAPTVVLKLPLSPPNGASVRICISKSLVVN